MQTPSFGHLARGVYVAPWVGPNDELVLFALTSKKRLACEPVTVVHGASRVRAADSLWEFLDREDPDVGTFLKAI